MNEQELRSFLMAFHAWHELADGMAQRRARSRMLFLCLLMRHTGMRLGEALAFRDDVDLDAGACSVSVLGARARMIPVSSRAAKELAELRDSPAVVRDKGILCRLDPGYVRRVFEARGAEAGLTFRMNPSRLRRAREEELRRMGIEDETVRFIMGREGRLDETAMLAVRQAFRSWEGRRNVGRHNCFRGVIEELERGTFCVRIRMRTDAGFPLSIRCTSRTASRLGLERGCRITASFRSLKGRLARYPDGINSFPCSVTDIYDDGGDQKVLLELEGSAKCCVIMDRAGRREGLTPGVKVWLGVDETDFDVAADLRLPEA